jgi:hypothetical protein
MLGGLTMIKLNNGATPIVWLVRNGGPMERPFCGVVVAETNTGYHPYVCWSMFSDDGEEWDCVWGNYCHTIDEAIESFNERIAGSIDDVSIYENRKGELIENIK